MSDRPLPDDPARWPVNPCELLGVPYGSPLRDLRRAYTRLIRIYKPEQYPEEFRLIRAAYDRMLPFARDNDAEAQAPADPAPDPDPAPREQPAVRATWQPVSRGVEEELDELWEAAIDGDATVAYRRLVQLSDQHSNRVDIYLRLYWLLTCTPGLDDAAVPADWLARGLHATSTAGPLRELYREEVEADPREAFSERFSSLLDARGTPGVVADLLEWRFRAATRLGSWDAIAEDVRRLGEWFCRRDEKIWLRVVFALADEVAWAKGSTAAALLTFCREEVKRLEHLFHEYSRGFDRFDWLESAAPGYRDLLRQSGAREVLRASHIPYDLLELIRLAWTRPFGEVQPVLQSVLGGIVREPRLWLAYLDQVQGASPGALALFGNMLDQFESNLGRAAPKADPATADRLVREFVSWSASHGYPSYRPALLEMCIREALTHAQIVEVAADLPGNWAEPGARFAREIGNDWPVCYACRAWHLFWS